MAVKRFSGSFKTRTDILDNITPNNVVQPNVSVPAGEWKPAAWLPVQWQGEASKDFFVISSGKIVCMDNTGRIVPARYRWFSDGTNAANDDVILSYTADDVTAATEDITTGSPVTAAKDVTTLEFCTAVIERGFINTAIGEGAIDNDVQLLDGDTNDADCRTVLKMFVSAPVGVCAYDVYSWAGDAPGELKMVNYQKQHLVQFFTDIQLKVPVHALHAADGLDGNGSGAAQLQTATVANRLTWAQGQDDGLGFHFPIAGMAEGNAADGGVYLTSTLLASLTRYDGLVAAGDDVVGIVVPNAPIAANTARTPITGDDLVRERKSIDRLRQAGDFYVDAEVGIILAFEADGNNPAGALGAEITYYAYDIAQTSRALSAADAHRYVHFSKVPRPGTHVTYDQLSNFQPINVADDGSTDPKLIVGRCLGVVKEPTGLLDRVRTAWEGSSFGKDAQMPGSATEGFSDLISLSDEGTSDTIALINVKV